MAIQLKYGWPESGALTANLPIKEGENIVAGMCVKKDANGFAVKADGSAGERAFVAMDDQLSGSVQQSRSLSVSTKNLDYLTDQILADAYAIGDELEVAPAPEQGKLRKYTAGTAPVHGTFQGYETVNNVQYANVLMDK